MEQMACNGMQACAHALHRLQLRASAPRGSQRGQRTLRRNVSGPVMWVW